MGDLPCKIARPFRIIEKTRGHAQRQLQLALATSGRVARDTHMLPHRQQVV